VRWIARLEGSWKANKPQACINPPLTLTLYEGPMKAVLRVYEGKSGCWQVLIADFGCAASIKADDFSDGGNHTHTPTYPMHTHTHTHTHLYHGEYS